MKQQQAIQFRNTTKQQTAERDGEGIIQKAQRAEAASSRAGNISSSKAPDIYNGSLFRNDAQTCSAAVAPQALLDLSSREVIGHLAGAVVEIPVDSGTAFLFQSCDVGGPDLSQMTDEVLKADS